MDFVVLADNRVKIKEIEKRKQVLEPCQRTKKFMKHETVIPILNGALVTKT